MLFRVGIYSGWNMVSKVQFNGLPLKPIALNSELYVMKKWGRKDLQSNLHGVFLYFCPKTFSEIHHKSVLTGGQYATGSH